MICQLQYHLICCCIYYCIHSDLNVTSDSALCMNVFRSIIHGADEWPLSGPPWKTDVTVTKPDKYRLIRGGLVSVQWYTIVWGHLHSLMILRGGWRRMRVGRWSQFSVELSQIPIRGQFQHNYYTIFFLIFYFMILNERRK